MNIGPVSMSGIPKDVASRLYGIGGRPRRIAFNNTSENNDDDQIMEI